MSTQGVEEEGLDFEAEEDDLMDEDGADLQQQQILPKLKSAITATAVTKKTKGRGFREEAASTRLAGHGFHSLDSDPGPGPERSIEGWIILVTGVHEEAQEDNLQEEFGEFGYIKNLHLNLDRRTGFVKEFESKVIAVLETLACRSKTMEKKGKIALFAESYSRELNIESASNGYALIEYEEFEDAQKAIKAMDGAELLTQTINVDWAFSRGPFKSKNVRRGGPRRQRSRSPIRKH